MLYPIRPFIEGDPEFPTVNSFGYNFWKRGWTETFQIGVSGEEFDRRFRLINELIDEYREGGFAVNWALFGQREDVSVCDESRISPIFDIKSGDRKLSVEISYFDHTRNHVYPNGLEVVRGMGEMEELVVGGFHESDCVPRIVEVARKLGIKASSDWAITDRFFHEMLRSFDHDMFAYMIGKGTLDAEMHEDDPVEEKKMLFGGGLRDHL